METFDKYGIKLSLELNADRSVNLSKMMHIEYFDENEEQCQFDAYPDKLEGKNYGTVECQFDYIKSVIKFDRAYTSATLKNIKRFFDEHPLVSPSGLSVEAGFSPRYVPLVLTGEKPITKNIIEGIMPVLTKYGFGRSKPNNISEYIDEIQEFVKDAKVKEIPPNKFEKAKESFKKYGLQ